MKCLNYTLMVFLLIPACLWCQPKWEWGMFVGGANYFGDLVETDWPVWSESQPAVGVSGAFNLSRVFSVKAGAVYARLSGDDANFSEGQPHLNRKFSFESQLTEFSLVFRYEPFGKGRYPDSGGIKPRIFSPYLYVGGGILNINPSPDFSEAPGDVFLEKIREDRNADFDKMLYVVPVGGGVRIDISRRSSLGVEAGIRPAFSDYLDGVSISGNPDGDDWYAFGGLAYSVQIGPQDQDRDGIVDKEDRCPRVKGGIMGKGCPDRDGDGVEDLEDVCPDTYGKWELNGCPDTDDDGIADANDACPLLAGKIPTQGCPDEDDDGIVDKEDECPEHAGPLEYNGCPDTDGDLILDKNDECPKEPGIEEKQGCPFYDLDADGIEDKDDDCPEEYGNPEANGCPDADVDGVMDWEDQCPESPGERENSGCPKISEEAQQILDFAAQAVEFETGSAVLKEESLKILDQIADVLKEFDGYSLVINGHTDSRGNDKTNQTLSEKRAKSCYDYLLTKSVSKHRMEYKGFGETRPIGNNNTAAGRKMNRRVEFGVFLPDRREEKTEESNE